MTARVAETSVAETRESALGVAGNGWLKVGENRVK